MDENTQQPVTPDDYNVYQEQSDEPQKTPFFQQQISMQLLTIVAAAAVLLIGTLGLFLGLQINKTGTFEKQADTYKAAMMSTEEGKKQLEQANANLSSQNQNLDQQAADANQKADAAADQAAEANQQAADASQQAADAQTKQAAAEQDAASAKKKLDAANQELQNKLAEVQKVNNDLNAKKADLEKANRGIALFNDVENLFTQYDYAAGKFTSALSNAYKAILQQDRASYDYYVSQLDTYSDSLDAVHDHILSLFEDIKNGNY